MEEIVKVADNNIEVRTYRLAKLDEKIYEKTKAYGKIRLEAELSKTDAEILSLTNLDPVKE